MPHPHEPESYLFGANSVFVEELYARYQENPASVDPSWRSFFDELGDGRDAVLREAKGPSWGNGRTAVIGQIDPAELAEKSKKKAGGKGLDAAAVEQAARDSVNALALIHAYRQRGHLIANLDPLGLEVREQHPELNPQTHGFIKEEDLHRPIYIGGVFGIEQATVREILDILQQTYCGTIGVEYTHIEIPEQRAWIQQRIESVHGRPQLSDNEKKLALSALIEVEAFEQFLHIKYPGTKRFSIQGGDAMIPALEMILLAASNLDCREFVLGMPHRGRMNVLTTIMGKPYIELLSIFHGNLDFPEWIESSGDVKYHLGASSDRTLGNGKTVHLSLTANPSHLEAVNPVVSGKVRAKQDQRGDEEKKEVMGILLHGDAAFSGQGVVAETLSLSELRGYRTGGTVHVIVNNQIGFTTSPKHGRFTPYPSDVAKTVQAPIFHVNGDDAEAVIWASKLATEFRQTFKRDVVLDIFCYRKFGHNESDEPSFTQPLMYDRIRKKKAPALIYGEKLVADGVLSEGELQDEFTRFREQFEKFFEMARDFKPNKADWLEGQWSGFKKPRGLHPGAETGVDMEILKEVGLKISKVPSPKKVKIHRKIERLLDQKRKMIESGEGIDWATGEALAFGTLLAENHAVRLSGQDSGRGTFSQRHSVLVGQDDEKRYLPLNHVAKKQANFEVIDSNLSEYAILGFEYGYSLAEPNALTLWEAQFGDFSNGAQIMIDQFIASGEIKWLRMSGLVMLLPHGYEGQGPEHSSARLERYLQLCAEDNMQVANCTTPANYFHILRRQLKRDFRKPLIIMTPKSLLRHKMAVSRLEEMQAGTGFQPVIGEVDKLASDARVQRLVLCSGKVYYDLLEARRERKIRDVAIVRVEQYYPFPGELLAAELKKYKNAKLIWCQEEPKNNGAWFFMQPRLNDLLEELDHPAGRVIYAGRAESASPATGYLKIHQLEQNKLINEALEDPAEENSKGQETGKSKKRAA